MHSNIALNAFNTACTQHTNYSPQSQSVYSVIGFTSIPTSEISLINSASGVFVFARSVCLLPVPTFSSRSCDIFCWLHNFFCPLLFHHFHFITIYRHFLLRTYTSFNLWKQRAFLVLCFLRTIKQRMRESRRRAKRLQKEEQRGGWSLRLGSEWRMIGGSIITTPIRIEKRSSSERLPNLHTHAHALKGSVL